MRLMSSPSSSDPAGPDLTQPDVRVLVVHSDPADLAVLASVVAAHGFSLHVLESSERLVAEVARYRPDAVVLDVKQRDCDGYELCLALKTDPLTAGVAVILTGSLDGPEARRRAFSAGCDDFLEKPIQRQVLAYRLRSFARLRRAWLVSAGSGESQD
jgi:PleD family two-component response regulator